MPAIVVERLQRAFGDLLAVRGVDLTVEEGEIYGFLGPNGAGKTTTVRMLTTLLLPTGGRASVAGHDVVGEAHAVRSSIGVALQEAALDPLMTGRELIRLQATLHGLSGEEGRRRADQLLERVDLSAAADRRVGSYSGGMQRRLDLAAALEMGFVDRLFAAPISRYAVVLGSLAGTAALGVVAALWFLAIGLIFGAEVAGGLTGALVATAVTAAATVAIGGIVSALALWTGKTSILQGLFPLIFVVLFLSTAFFPEGLMVEPAKSIAQYNPLSFVVEGIREPIISGLDGSDVFGAVVAIVGIGALSLLLSARAMRHRLATGG